MKISERLALLKAGYTKEDIAEMIGEESKPAEPADQQPTEESGAASDRYMEALVALAGEVKSMKEAIQSSNISNTTITEKSPLDQASEILASLINKPAEPNKKGEKINHGS